MSRINQMLDILEHKKINFIVKKTQGPIYYIIFNRPQKGNAMTLHMYFNFTEFIKEANQDNSIKFIVVYGEGKNFSTGNDLNDQDPDLQKYTYQEMLEFSNKHVVFNFSKAIIQSVKPIFGLVQGRATGVAFTQLAHYQKVYAVQNTIFQAPLVKIAIGPQLCSSYTFPKIFGKQMASDILIRGKDFTANELSQFNFLQICKNFEQAKHKLKIHLSQLNELNWQSYMACRKLMKTNQSQILEKTNILEFQNLNQRRKNPQISKIYKEKHLAFQKKKRSKL